MHLSYLEKWGDFCCIFDWRGGQKKFTIQYFRHLWTVLSSFLFFFPTPKSRGAESIKLPFNGIYRSPGGRNVVEQPGLEIHYLGKLCSICPPISPFSSRYQAGRPISDKEIKLEKNAPQIIPKSHKNIFLCLNLSHRRLKNRELLTVGEKLKLSLPCQELTNSNGERLKVTLRGFSLSLILPPTLFSGAKERAHLGIRPGPNQMTENEASEIWLQDKARRADGWWERG